MPSITAPSMSGCCTVAVTVRPPPASRRAADAPRGVAGLDLPDPVDEHRDLGALAGDAGDHDLWCPDHEIDVDARMVNVFAVGFVDRVRVGGADGNVAGRILVQERVVEDGPKRADASAGVHQGDLAQT